MDQDEERRRIDRNRDHSMSNPEDIMTQDPAIPAIDETRKELVNLRDLLEAGVHLGHHTKRWNPKMSRYIYGSRNGVHIIDLRLTQKLFNQAYETVENLVARGGSVLFVGTKRQAMEVIAEEATRCGMHSVTYRWLGGTLTNFATIRNTVERMKRIDAMRADGSLDAFVKKERLKMEKEYDKMNRFVGGIKDMEALPAAVFIVDPTKEYNAVAEARKLKIPVIALIDTNGDPDNIDLPIPGNDDAIRTIKLITSRIADAVQEGVKRRREVMKGTATRGEAAGEGPKVEQRHARSRSRAKAAAVVAKYDEATDAETEEK